MQNITFSAGFIRANIFSALLCILLPVLFLWYYKKKTGVKLVSFFIGAAFCLLFTYIAPIFLNLVVYGLGLTIFFNASVHPIYSAVYGAFSLGLCSTVGCLIALKYSMKKRPGKENSLVFGVGMGTLESLLNGTTVYVTNLFAAILINSIGSAEYFKKIGLTGKELTKHQQLFAEQAATPASAFLVDATYQILSLVLYAAVATLIFHAIEHRKTYLTATAVILHIMGYLPLYLHSIPQFQNSTLLLTIATLYAFVVALFGWQTYHHS